MDPQRFPLISIIEFIELIHLIDSPRKRQENEKTDEQTFHGF